MRTTILLVAAVILSGCGSRNAAQDQTIAREHKAKATDMCKHDKGLKQVIEASGMGFTAECKSGIIVAGIAEKQLN